MKSPVFAFNTAAKLAEAGCDADRLKVALPRRQRTVLSPQSEPCETAAWRPKISWLKLYLR